MSKMNNKEKLRIKIIEAIHGKPYEEAMEDYLLSASDDNPVLVESWDSYYQPIYSAYIDSPENGQKKYVIDFRGSDNYNHCQDCNIEEVHYPITIGRVMQALMNKSIFIKRSDEYKDGKLCLEFIYVETDLEEDIGEVRWGLTRNNFQETTLDDQSTETINTLLELFEN